jgi:hypothetical protein
MVETACGADASTQKLSVLGALPLGQLRSISDVEPALLSYILDVFHDQGGVEGFLGSVENLS